MTIRTKRNILLCSLVVLGGLRASAQDRRLAPVNGSGRRYALIIGNNAYPWKPLKNAVNDARDLAAELPRVGFAATDITLVTDANLLAMQKASVEFLQKLRADDLAFVFYSGHGVEVRGENYLAPIDFPSNASELDVQYRAFSAQQFLHNLETSPARARIMILDACRDNPLRATRSAAGGLARMDPSGTLIVFATGSGRTADDNATGRNGFFTAHLLKDLPTPGLSVSNLMQQVGREVNRDSGGKQTPALYGLLLEDFPLLGGAAPAAAAATTVAPAPVTPTPVMASAEEAWRMVRETTNPEDLDDFVKHFPNSAHASVATLRAGQLRRAASSMVAVAVVLNQAWTDTGVYLTPGKTFTVTARGTMNWYTGACDGKCVSSPAGIPCPGGGPKLRGLTCLSLIGKIGQNGRPFDVGESFTGRAQVGGKLFLGPNDDNLADNTGNWTAQVVAQR